MRRWRLAGPVLVAVGMLAAVSGCGSSSPPAGATLAKAACKSSGTHAATLAGEAARANSRYAALATDERTDAASEAAEEQELGGSGANGALVSEENVGTAAGDKVIEDCVSLGLPVTGG